MITEFFERLFVNNNRGSRDDVKRRLTLVLAHDRSTLNASTLEKMRKEMKERQRKRKKWEDRLKERRKEERINKETKEKMKGTSRKGRTNLMK